VIILVFVDGLGLGEKNSRKNPCAAHGIKHLSRFIDEDGLNDSDHRGILIPTEATLGVAGLPQSATGQASLFSGINCSQSLGRHLQGFPNQTLRDILKEHSILKKTKEKGFRSVFINAYRSVFFSLPENIKWKLSVTTIVTLSAGLPFFGLEDIVQERSIYHDMTNEGLIQRGFDVPLFSVEKAARVLAEASEEYDFILYEYFLTDKAGHSQQMDRARSEIFKIDRFVDTLLSSIDLGKHTVMLTSDHGNIEDLSVKTHTRNPVMTILWGRGQNELKNRIRSLTDVTPFILWALETIHSNQFSQTDPVV
jgi:2,3-bisphosphoglycerate-independent phosphoglycerate mutase